LHNICENVFAFVFVSSFLSYVLPRLLAWTARTLDILSKGREFDSRSGRYQMVTTWMGDCLQKGKLSLYITNTKVNSAFHPSAVGESSTGLPRWC